MPITSDEQIQKAAQFWNNQTRKSGSGRDRWWHHPRILAHINRTICGKPLAGFTDGMIERIKNHPAFNGGGKAISIGCGNGAKEMSLIEHRAAQSFDLYDISEERTRQGKKLAMEKRIADRVRFLKYSPMNNDVSEGCYDLVYWDNSLHHMQDVHVAVLWSKKVLKMGGIFAMNDFVAPTRCQWTKFNLDIVAALRAILPPRLMENRKNPGTAYPVTVDRPSLDWLMKNDPSEAADSGSILDAVRKYFPDASITLTGGCVYHLCLNDILANFEDSRDDTLLDLLLIVDDICAGMGQTHYAVAFASKT